MVSYIEALYIVTIIIIEEEEFDLDSKDNLKPFPHFYIHSFSLTV